MQLNMAVSLRLKQLLEQNNMTQYMLYKRSGVPKSTINNMINCSYDSLKLRVIHEICQGFNISIEDFFHSPLFNENNLEP
ncbi:MAG: helix-turn-helix transcriptional regulator [Clostridia bacterium]|nr:helix-turn-helix transcriptional regulator [Clostridia bacterium]